MKVETVRDLLDLGSKIIVSPMITSIYYDQKKMFELCRKRHYIVHSYRGNIKKLDNGVRNKLISIIEHEVEYEYE